MSEIVVTESWIVSQLEGIRSLELELSAALARPKTQRRTLQAKVARLNAWVELVEQALTQPA